MAIYAIDFDGTLAYTNFPEILAPNEKIVAFTRLIQTQGHKIILWTSRVGKDLDAAVEWCAEQGIVFDAVNESLPEQIQLWGGDTRKVYADFYIDDHVITIDQAEQIVDHMTWQSCPGQRLMAYM